MKRTRSIGRTGIHSTKNGRRSQERPPHALHMEAFARTQTVRNQALAPSLMEYEIAEHYKQDTASKGSQKTPSRLEKNRRHQKYYAPLEDTLNKKRLYSRPSRRKHGYIRLRSGTTRGPNKLIRSRNAGKNTNACLSLVHAEQANGKRRQPKANPYYYHFHCCTKAIFFVPYRRYTTRSYGGIAPPNTPELR